MVLQWFLHVHCLKHWYLRSLEHVAVEKPCATTLSITMFLPTDNAKDIA